MSDSWSGVIKCLIYGSPTILGVDGSTECIHALILMGRPAKVGSSRLNGLCTKFLFYPRGVVPWSVKFRLVVLPIYVALEWLKHEQSLECATAFVFQVQSYAKCYNLLILSLCNCRLIGNAVQRRVSFLYTCFLADRTNGRATVLTIMLMLLCCVCRLSVRNVLWLNSAS